MLCYMSPEKSILFSDVNIGSMGIEDDMRSLNMLKIHVLYCITSSATVGSMGFNKGPYKG